MTPPASWYTLQLRFAQRAAAVSGLPFEEALLRFTNCDRRCGLGRFRDAEHPTWRAYLRGLRDSVDKAGWTAEFCRTHAEPVRADFFGCFRYDYLPEARMVQLHFSNNDHSGVGPLSRERQPVRTAELCALFSALARAHPDALTVRGVSWLHGVPAYRRLFPPAYGESAIPLPAEKALPSMPLWGQFLDHAERVKTELASPFLDRIEQANTFTELAVCFPLLVYAVELSVDDFYRFYDVPR